MMKQGRSAKYFAECVSKIKAEIVYQEHAGGFYPHVKIEAASATQ